MKVFNKILSLLYAAAFACALGISTKVVATIVPGSNNLGAIWFIGDSITQGNADQDPNGYTVRSTLYNFLSAAGYTFTYTGHFTANSNGLPITGSSPSNGLYQYHSGVSGAVIGTNYSGRTGITQNLPGWWTNSSSRLSSVQPNVILIMIGANDANLGLDITNAPARLSQLIDTIYAQPGVGNPTILVAAITPDRANSSAPANVAFFNAAVPGVVQSFQNLGDDVYMVDQFTILNANYPVSINTDNLHPNTEGNNYMASNWLYTISGYVGATVPASPCGITATPAYGMVTLSWSTVPGASYGYNIKRSTVSGGFYTTIATNITANNYADTNIANRTAYYYAVTAANAKGEGANSSQVAATPAALPPPVITVTVSNNQVVLSWAAVSGATGYYIKRSPSNGGAYTTIATNVTTSFNDENLIVGATYYYVVSAFDGQGESADSTQVAASAVLPTQVYIGDDAMEETNITAGNGQDSISTTLTYAFVQSGTLYTNVSGSSQAIQLTQVNFQAGTAAGSIQPFVADYIGGQNASNVESKANYNVLLVGDPVIVAANSGLQNVSFLAGGTNPIITLNPGAVLAAGYLTSGGGVITLSTTATGLIDYIYNGNSLPTMVPNPLNFNSSFSLDRTLKFNVGFGVGIPTTNTLRSSLNPSAYGSSVTFTATISPAPTNGETVTFMDGANTLGSGIISGGQSTFTTNALAGGSHSVMAIYGGDFHYLSSTSSTLAQIVNGSAPALAIYPIAGSQSQISWPAVNLGWHLQAQTNSSLVGLSTNWVMIPGSGSVTSVNMTINPAQGSVFYRMISP
jgi:fibronectin type 3 domain-containing protein